MKRTYTLLTISMMLWAARAVSAQEQPVGPFAAFTGEIAAKTLHVRSGPSTNYYPVARLSAGARVDVVGQESGWLAISPPPGCFSLIAAKFVDRKGGTGGVVNAENVRIRAGSELSPHNYAIQLKLSKGAAVNILGSMDAEFLKIAPPPGARVWVAGEYVRRVGDAATSGAVTDASNSATDSAGIAITAEASKPVDSAAIEPPPAKGSGAVSTTTDPITAAPSAETFASAPQGDAGQRSGETDLPSGDDDGPAGEALSAATTALPASTGATIETGRVESRSVAQQTPPASPASTPSPDPAQSDPAQLEAGQKEIEALDAQLADEMAKPLLSRDIAPLLPRYRELAERNGDEYTQAYARIRIQQIEAALEMIEGVRTIGRLKDEVHTVRQTSHAGRSSIRYMPVRVDGGFDIEGELRPSALYESPIGPKRYRLVDTKASPARTIGYVEVPADPPIDLSSFLGRRVGVRARERMLQSGDVDPLSIYVASELVALTPASDGSSQTMVSIKIPSAGTSQSAPGSSATESPTASLP